MVAAPDTSDFSKTEIRDILNDVRNPFDVAVYGSENYFNTGGIIRTCHNFLTRNIYLIDMPQGDEFYQKACMGAQKYENLIKLTMDEFIEMSNSRNVVICERRLNIKSKNLVYFKYPELPILTFGSEKFGIPDKLIDNFSENIVSIPQYGLLNDMSVSVAAGMIMYDWIAKNYAGIK